MNDKYFYFIGLECEKCGQQHPGYLQNSAGCIKVIKPKCNCGNKVYYDVLAFEKINRDALNKFLEMRK